MAAIQRCTTELEHEKNFFFFSREFVDDDEMVSQHSKSFINLKVSKCCVLSKTRVS